MKKVQFLKTTKAATVSIMLASTLLAMGCAGNSQARDGDKQADYQKLRADVMAAADKAASVGGEWRDTRWNKSTFVKWKNAEGKTIKGSFVGIADAAAAEGDYAKATELLNTAKFQAEMGYNQAMEQKGAGPRFASSPIGKYKALLASTTAIVDKAASVGGEWRDTRWNKSKFVKYTAPDDGTTIKSSYMGAAAEAAKHGDYEKAIEFLETAKFQGEMGYRQAMEQKNAGPRF